MSKYDDFDLDIQHENLLNNKNTVTFTGPTTFPDKTKICTFGLICTTGCI